MAAGDSLDGELKATRGERRTSNSNGSSRGSCGIRKEER